MIRSITRKARKLQKDMKAVQRNLLFGDAAHSVAARNSLFAPDEEIRYLDGGPEYMLDDPRVQAVLEEAARKALSEALHELREEENVSRRHRHNSAPRDFPWWTIFVPGSRKRGSE